jgi:tetratricopeptide (TPR) repeat protein
MRLVAFLFLQLASQDNQVSADQLYTQITRLIPQMEQTRDSVTYYQLLYKTLSKALACDSIEALPNKKGKSNPRYRKQLSRQLRTLRPHLIDGGMMYYARHDNPTALRFFHLYLQTHSSPLFHLSAKQQYVYLGAVSYYASLLAYGEKHFREADRYADIALNDSNVAEDAAEIKVNCMRELMRTPLDSSRYELALLALHDNAPDNAVYFHLLTDFLSRPGHEGELENFAKDELAKDSLNANIWSLWGEIYMRKRSWDRAIKALEKADTIDSTQVQVVYNIGICWGEKAQEKWGKDMEDNVDNPPAASEKALKGKECYVCLENAGNAFRRVALLDPQQTQVKWKEAAEHVDAAIQKMKDSVSAPIPKKTSHRRGRRR